MPAPRQLLPMVGEPRSARIPPCTARVERLDPAVEHLRKARDGRHVGYRQPCLAQRPAPCRRSTRAPSPCHQPTAKDASPSCRRQTAARAVEPAASHRQRGVQRDPTRAFVTVARRPAAPGDDAGSSRCSTAWTRASNVSSVSPADTVPAPGRRSARRRGLASTKCTVTPVTRRPRRGRPGRLQTRERRQQRLGWTFRMRPRKAESTADRPPACTRRAPRRRLRPRRGCPPALGPMPVCRVGYGIAQRRSRALARPPSPARRTAGRRRRARSHHPAPRVSRCGRSARRFEPVAGDPDRDPSAHRALPSSVPTADRCRVDRRSPTPTPGYAGRRPCHGRRRVPPPAPRTIPSHVRR